jgi:hypothetical protein
MVSGNANQFIDLRTTVGSVRFFSNQQVLFSAGEFLQTQKSLLLQTSPKALNVYVQYVTHEWGDTSSGKYGSLKTFRTFNIKRQVFFGFYRATQKHYIMELNFGGIRLNFHPEDVSELVGSWTEFSSLLIDDDPNKIAKGRLASTSTNFGQIEFEEPVKISVNIRLESIAVLLPTLGNRKISFLLEDCVCVSGDYFQDICKNSFQQVPSFSSNKSTILERMKLFANPLSLSFLCLISKISILHGTSIILYPASSCGIFSISSISSNPDFCESYADLFFSTLTVNLTNQVFLCNTIAKVRIFLFLF